MGLILDAGWTAKATAEHLGMNARSVAGRLVQFRAGHKAAPPARLTGIADEKVERQLVY